MAYPATYYIAKLCSYYLLAGWSRVVQQLSQISNCIKDALPCHQCWYTVGLGDAFSILRFCPLKRVAGEGTAAFVDHCQATRMAVHGVKREREIRNPQKSQTQRPEECLVSENLSRASSSLCVLFILFYIGTKQRRTWIFIAVHRTQTTDRFVLWTFRDRQGIALNELRDSSTAPSTQSNSSSKSRRRNKEKSRIRDGKEKDNDFAEDWMAIC